MKELAKSVGAYTDAVSERSDPWAILLAFAALFAGIAYGFSWVNADMWAAIFWACSIAASILSLLAGRVDSNGE